MCAHLLLQMYLFSTHTDSHVTKCINSHSINSAAIGGCNQMCGQHGSQLSLPLADVCFVCLWKLFEDYSIIPAQGKMTICEAPVGV